MSQPLLVCRGIEARRGEPAEAPAILSGFELDLAPGDCVALCGPSGSGKTTACLAPFGLAGSELRVAGTATFAGDPASDWVGRQQPGGVAFIFQEPSANFSPHLKIKQQLADLKQNVSSCEMARWGGELGLTAWSRLLDQYPAQCSGGELQRLALVAALAQAPALLVADEPTAALDAASRDAWAGLVLRQQREGLAVLLASHDRALLNLLACRRKILAPPGLARGAHPEVKHRPPVPGSRARTSMQAGAVCRVRWQIRVAGSGGATGVTDTTRAYALDTKDAEFTVWGGECLALVGPSGGGKSSLLRLVLGLPTAVRGTVFRKGHSPAAAGRMGAVLQEPRSGLCPHRAVVDTVAAGLRRRGHAWRACRALAAAELHALGVPENTWERYPPSLSVGQAQRVALAAALAGQPALLVCDEPTSAQDAGHRELVLQRLLRARDHEGCAVLLATHDLEFAEALGARTLLIGGEPG